MKKNNLKKKYLDNKKILHFGLSVLIFSPFKFHCVTLTEFTWIKHKVVIFLPLKIPKDKLVLYSRQERGHFTLIKYLHSHVHFFSLLDSKIIILIYLIWMLTK